MRCNEIQDNLSAYLDKELPADLTDAVRAHVEGCAECRTTGYRGRQVIAEALEVTGEIGAAIRRGAPTAELRALGVGQGMKTMAGHGVLRASAGETSLEEALMMVPRING